MADPREAAKEKRLAAIRARRGTPERLTEIAGIAERRREAQRRTKSSDGRKTPENSTTFFGHTWAEWFRMRDAGYAFLCERASHRRMVSYREVWDAVGNALPFDIGPMYRQVPHLLRYISMYAVDEFGFLPTALVTYDGDPDVGPGPGFFRLAGSLGLIPEADVPAEGEEWRAMTPNQRRFWTEQLEGTFGRFANPADGAPVRSDG